jgi:cellulose synthase (UDP-forming)
LIAPIVYLWSGMLPMVNVTPEAVLYYLLPMIVAVASGIWTFAPRHYFPFAAQVHGTFQSFKILPTVLVTMARPFGHVFKVTPKGAGARAADYDRQIFWTSGSLLGLTIVGLLINSQPDLRIIGQSGLLLIVACWSTINIVVLFLVCMMSLQAPARRGEERFKLDEPVWIFAANGALSTGRIADISLSGVAIVADENRALATKKGERARIFLAEIGFVAATVVRQSGRFLAVQFDLPPCLERDLLVRKLFTAGLDATTVNASALSTTSAMLMSIWSTGTTKPEPQVAPQVLAAPVVRLPAQTRVIEPQQQGQRLADIAAQRKIAA